ncbi:hypothetical protein BB65665_16203 [Bacillus sp. 916]|nr:hypothetical protein BAMY6614_12600 [Bacillus amyloliquefaciens UMAF6614]EJD66507.1 hypothetical protein BB65665_16203 [Bacillus sp. 916]ERH59358.1 hypothetical protein O205_02020 [Bacillus amyloliquefaciens EGD-AQ14]
MSTPRKQLLPSGKMGGIFFEYYMNKAIYHLFVLSI